MKIQSLFTLALAGAASLAALPAVAHITLLNKSAAVGSTYMAVFRVPHGCSGAATTAVRIQIPTGVYEAKPQPKAGWTLTVTNGKYQVPYTNRGTQLSEGVTEIDYTGNKLPDADYDEFTLYTSLADSLKPGTPLYFPTVQECEGGAAARWIEIPAAGKTTGDYQNPAPSVMLTAQ